MQWTCNFIFISISKSCRHNQEHLLILSVWVHESTYLNACYQLLLYALILYSSPDHVTADGHFIWFQLIRSKFVPRSSLFGSKVKLSNVFSNYFCWVFFFLLLNNAHGFEQFFYNLILSLFLRLHRLVLVPISYCDVNHYKPFCCFSAFCSLWPPTHKNTPLCAQTVLIMLLFTFA